MDRTRFRSAGEQTATATMPEPRQTPMGDWCRDLPVMAGAQVTIRPLRRDDAHSLFAMLGGDEVGRFISPPPSTVAGYEAFIENDHRSREQGQSFCFAIVPEGTDVAIGLIQVRRLDGGFETAEWGFALGSAFWGTGLFVDAAQLVLQFAFDVVGVQRMEARAVAINGRGNGALRKLGAIQEGVLRRSFQREGQRQDQVLWSILADEWNPRPMRLAARIH